MGTTKITIVVEGAPNMSDALDDEFELRVLKQPGACALCVMNNDPYRVPVHNKPGYTCRCTVVLVKKQ